MELKDMILQTLKELDTKIEEDGYKERLEVTQPTKLTKIESTSDEKEFLIHSKERLEVLFQGLNSEENIKVEAKLNLVINFLQFYLTKVDERLEKIV